MRQSLPLNKKSIVIASIAIVLLISLSLFYFLYKKSPSTSTSKPLEPSFSIITPDKKPATSLGGHTVTTPSGEETYQFETTIDGVRINISEQRLPDTMNGPDATDAVRKFANGFNATTIVTAGQTVVYTGASAAGPQWAIFTHQNLLIIAKADRSLSNETWARFVATLQ